MPRALGVAMSSLGLAAADSVGFHGSECVQANAITSVSTSASATSAYGFSSSQADSIVTTLNAILVALRNKGIIAT